MHILSCAPGYKEAYRSDILCYNVQWEHVIVLQNPLYHLTLYNQDQDWIYLPPRASLITSSADHTKKTKAVLHTQKQEGTTQNYKARSCCSNTICQETGTQADNKQGNDPV